MEITITHCRYAPRWVTLQAIIRETINDEAATITKINRSDKGCNYRGSGEYDLNVRQSNKTILPVKLKVVAVGE